MNKECVFDLLNWWSEHEYTLHDQIHSVFADKVCKMVDDAIHNIAGDITVQLEDLSDLDVVFGANHLDATHIGNEGNPAFYYKAKSGNLYWLNDEKRTWDLCHFDDTQTLIPVNFKEVL